MAACPMRCRGHPPPPKPSPALRHHAVIGPIDPDHRPRSAWGGLRWYLHFPGGVSLGAQDAAVLRLVGAVDRISER